MPNSWSKQDYVQGFDCDSTTCNKSVNIFERTEIAESIYEGVVEPYYKSLLGKMPTVLVTAGKREENPPCIGLSLRRVRVLASAEKGM